MLGNWERGIDEESNPTNTLHESNQTELKFESSWSDALAVEPTQEEPTLALSTALFKEPVKLDQYEYANDNKAQHLTAAPTEGTEQLDEAEKQELFTLEDEILQASALHKRWWYSGGKTLGYIRDKRLYRETYSDFHQYCLERFNTPLSSL